MIKVTLDSDQGVGIDECTAIARVINAKIEESKVVELYELEVTSPGVGEPLKIDRQYIKNIGRTVKITTTEGKNKEGKLLQAIPGDKIVVEEYEKKKFKIISAKQVEIPFAQIKRTIVLVSFN